MNRHSVYRVIVAVLAMIVVGLSRLKADSSGLVWLCTVAGSLALIYCCWPLAQQSWQDMRRRKMSMEMSMLLAVVAAAAVEELVTALVITTFALIAEILEDLCLNRGHDALEDLMSFLPTTVRVRRSQEQELPLAEIEAGDVVIIGPGGKVPVDGVVVRGHSTLDTSRLTGESLPVEVQPGTEVHAGSVNQSGGLEIQATKVGEESSYGRILAVLKEARDSQAPVQRLADRYAAWLVTMALGAALLTFLITRDMRATISVIIVAGACGIAAGTPLALLGAIGQAARNGAFVKDGAHMEALSHVGMVALDKTGTLTTGALEVQEINPAPGISEKELLGLAASAEYYSEHPLGKAVVLVAQQENISVAPPDSFRAIHGKGVEAQVGGRLIRISKGARRGEIQVSEGESILGTLVLADTVRPSASEFLEGLHRDYIPVAMITGDQREAAEELAKEIGLDDVRAGLLPEDKLLEIDKFRDNLHSESHSATLVMVGDGVNDAPSLARADVGVAMGSATDVAQDTADVVLVSSDLNDLLATIRVARRARNIITANFVGTIVVDAIGMLLAATGLIGPVVAALIHVSSESIFILNSARLVVRRPL
ncbi:heavy metal translocating P-type ATPase [Corynebacterium poyangense]|nr:cation-translocating P-type ATPase [Corynebacterium poyangense]